MTNLFNMDSISRYSGISIYSMYNENKEFRETSSFNIFDDVQECIDLEVSIFVSILEETEDCIQLLSRNDAPYTEDEDYKKSANDIYSEYIGGYLFDTVTLEPNNAPGDLHWRIKSTKDKGYIRYILKCTVADLKAVKIFPTLHESLYYYHFRKLGEKNILKANRLLTRQKTNLQRSLLLKEIDTQTQLAEIDSRVSKAKEELHDAEVLYFAKIRFNDKYNRARYDQTSLLLQNNTNVLVDFIRKIDIQIDNENLVHELTCSFIKDMTKAITEKILIYCDNYDENVESLDNDIIKRSTDIDKLNRQVFKLRFNYERRIREMNRFVKERTEYFEYRRKGEAATNLQAWFRGLYYRHGYMKKNKGKKKGKK